MKTLELLKNQENIIPEELQSKKIKPLAKTLHSLIIEMDEQVKSFTVYKESQLEGELASKIIIAKSLADFFANNKILHVELAAEALHNEEKSKLNEFYSVKTRLLDTLKTILKESQKEAVVSTHDVFEGEFQKCESGHEIIILNGRNTNVLETLIKEFDEYLIMSGNYDTIESQEVDFNTEVLERNIELCNRKNNEIFGAKAGKMRKLDAIINKLHEVGKDVVAFYTYKDSLLDIGCNPKNVKLYENELSKAYVPLKKTLQKEFKIELEDICDVVVNEEEFADNVEEVSSTNSWENPTTTEEQYYREPVVKDLFEETNTNNVVAEEQPIEVQPLSFDNAPTPTEIFNQPESSFTNTFDSAINQTVSTQTSNENVETFGSVNNIFDNSNTFQEKEEVSTNNQFGYQEESKNVSLDNSLSPSFEREETEESVSEYNTYSDNASTTNPFGYTEAQEEQNPFSSPLQNMFNNNTETNKKNIFED